MGVYMVNRNVMEYIPEDTFFGFDHLMYKLLEVEHPALVHEFDGFWLDIGRPSDYEMAIEKIKDPKFKIV